MTFGLPLLSQVIDYIYGNAERMDKSTAEIKMLPIKSNVFQGYLVRGSP